MRQKLLSLITAMALLMSFWGAAPITANAAETPASSQDGTYTVIFAAYDNGIHSFAVFLFNGRAG